MKMSSSRRSASAHVYTGLGSWGMPTIDPEGLAALALLRFVDIPFSVTSGASRSMTPANTLPVVIFEKRSGSGNVVVAGLAELIAMLASDVSLPDPNKSLTPFMVAESTAFVSLIQSRFGPAQLHEMYRIDQNYNHIHHLMLEKERSFPLNRILPYLRRNEIRRSLHGRTENSVYFDAKIALTALATRLGESKKFFYGDEPTVLDAVVFGYLASVMYIPTPESRLRSQISKHNNLIDFVRRVVEVHFDTDDIRINGDFDAEELAARWNDDAQQRARRATEGAPTEDTSAISAEEKERQRWNNYFIWGSVAAFATHMLLGSEIEFDVS